MPDENQDDVTDVNDYFKRHAKYRECRKFGHAFQATHPDYFRERESGALYQRLKCLRGCGLTAVDTWHPKTMDRIGQRQIDYGSQPDYLAKGTRISRLDMRLWERDNRKVRVEGASMSRRRTG